MRRAWSVFIEWVVYDLGGVLRGNNVCKRERCRRRMKRREGSWDKVKRGRALSTSGTKEQREKIKFFSR